MKVQKLNRKVHLLSPKGIESLLKHELIPKDKQRHRKVTGGSN